MSWQFPQGIEVLVKKASVDPDFAELLLADRETAAREIGLGLDQSEAMMLEAVPNAQLEAIIAQTIVPHEHRRAFLGKAAVAMLAALAAGVAEAGVFNKMPPAVGGVRPQYGGGGVRPAMPPKRAMPPMPRPSQVIVLLAAQLDVAVETISPKSTLAGDLGVDAKRGKAILQALQSHFNVAISSETFNRLVTVRDVIDCVDKATHMEPRVIRVIAEVLRIDKGPLSRETSLVTDLKITSAQRAGLRKELSKVFRIYIPWKTFLEYQTVGQVVDYVDEIVKRREAAKLPKEPPSPPSPVSRGVRPGPR